MLLAWTITFNMCPCVTFSALDLTRVHIKRNETLVSVMQLLFVQLLMTHSACVWTNNEAQLQRKLLMHCKSFCLPLLHHLRVCAW